MNDKQLTLIVAAAGGVGVWLWLRSRAGEDIAMGLIAPDVYAAAPRINAYAPVSGPVQVPAQGGQVVRIGPTGPGAGKVLGGAGVSAGVGIGAAAVGPGSVVAASLTAGIAAGAAALAWAIGSKGLFRGGEEALVINPLRDQYLSLWGPPGTGPESGFGKLAAELSMMTGEPNGSHYFTALTQAAYKNELAQATKDIQGVYAAHGIQVPAIEFS